MSRCAVLFGQFDAAADPVNLPHFVQRLHDAGIDCVLTDHEDTKSVVNFLRGYSGKVALVGASLGAGAAPIMAGYLREEVDFIGGFQPSDWDPVMHPVLIRQPNDVITRAVCVPKNVRSALCFRNPVAGLTGGLGHATWILAPDCVETSLQIIERPDVHPGDFGEAQDVMVQRVTEALR